MVHRSVWLVWLIFKHIWYVFTFVCVLNKYMSCRCGELELIEEKFEMLALVVVEIPPLARAVKHVRAEAAASQQLAGE